MKRNEYKRIEPTKTWKANYQELAASCEKAQAYCAFLRSMLYDAESSGLRFVCRTKGEYASEFGSMWYVARNGGVLQVDHDTHEVSTYANWDDALKLYATFQAAHNVAAYQVLTTAALAEVA